jgi:light-regulated signal transduction histidine kinase (bacteriophytochrome)
MIPALRDESLAVTYQRALSAYIEAPSEERLAEAYELARHALREGHALIDWAALHEAALLELGIATQGSEVMIRAGTFFRESLSPFEMTQRGYVEANDWLMRLNHELRNEIAEKERLARQLQEANEDLEAFNYSVAHDLRAPLRRLEGLSRVLVADHASSLDGEVLRLLGRMEVSARHMSDLIEGLIALSQTGRAELNVQTFDLAASARSLAAALQEAEPSRRVVFQIPATIPVKGDARLLGAVLQNLLQNAWKFTAKREQAHIELAVDASKIPAVYSVRDNGAGFSMARAHKLFGAFQRLHTNDAFPGTGIGLATVHRIIRKHGGRIWAQGAVDHGATFSFTLEPEPR